MIRADLADQTVSGPGTTQEFVAVNSSDRYRRHGHYPALVLVEDNPELAERLERALFEEEFEVLLVSDHAVAPSQWEIQYPAFESAGLVVIYSCSALAPELKAKLGGLGKNRFFDLSALQLPSEHDAAAQKILSRLQSLRYSQ